MKLPKQSLIDSVIGYRQSRQKTLARHKNNHPRPTSDSFRKGTEFETFVVKKFDPIYFNLVDWRSDKTVDGIYPIMSSYPDLEFFYKSASEEKFFAVECKWRECFKKGVISIKPWHLEKYRQFEKITEQITFIILGVGNTPVNPNVVYVIPLKAINDSGELHEFAINCFRRKNPADNFFLNCSAGILT